jgi:hypothetical protein
MAKRRSIQSGKRGAQRPAPEIKVGTVEASEFRLVDRSGRLQAVLESTPQGPRLAMMQSDGSVGLEITLAPDGPGIRLSDENGQTRVFVGAMRDAARLGMADGDGNQRLFIGVNARGAPSITLYDARQREVWEAPSPGSQR